MDGLRGALRGAAAALAARDGWAALPPADLPKTSIAALQLRHGTPVPLPALYAANTMGRDGAERMRKRQQADELSRRLAAKARWREEARHDRMADEWEAAHLREEGPRGRGDRGRR
ncbi:MAG: hypothetical protein E7001_02955 [Coriobacteriaceae bacterium]|nr:hypothetical protein [Coriobacteriaceae bacterium]